MTDWPPEKPRKRSRILDWLAIGLLVAALGCVLYVCSPLIILSFVQVRLLFSAALKEQKPLDMTSTDIILAYTPEYRTEHHIALPDASFAHLRIPKGFIVPSIYNTGHYRSDVLIAIDRKTIAAGILSEDILRTFFPDYYQWQKERPNIHYSSGFSLWSHGGRSMNHLLDMYRNTWSRTDINDPKFEKYVNISPSKDPVVKRVMDSLLLIPRDADPAGSLYMICKLNVPQERCEFHDEMNAQITIQSSLPRGKIQEWRKLRDALEELVRGFIVQP